MRNSLGRTLLAAALCLGALAALPPASAQPAAGDAMTLSVNAPTGLPASIPVKRDSDSAPPGGSSRAWALAPLLLVGALLLGLAWVRWRSQPGAAPGTPTANATGEESWSRWWRASRGHASDGPARLSSARLTPRHSLHVVQWEGRRLLVGCSDQSIRLLAESPLPLATPEEVR